MAKIVYRQMPAPQQLRQQMPAARAKARMQKPQGWGKFLVQIPEGARGVVMDETDTCITLMFKMQACELPPDQRSDSKTSA